MVKRLTLKLIVALAPLCVLAAVFLYALAIKPFSTDGKFCWVYESTGICCPTCGLTRAVYLIAQGDFKNAYYYHSLFTVGFIPFFVVSTAMGINWAIGNPLPFLKFRWIYFYLLLGIIVVFVVYRNLSGAIL